ncbi:MAG: hypothetical protein WAM66_10630 [Acidobacteriaceae bacterium]
MRVLFAVFVLCLAALIFTLIAFKRHIRKHRAPSGDPLSTTGTPREDTLKQND